MMRAGLCVIACAVALSAGAQETRVGKQAKEKGVQRCVKTIDNLVSFAQDDDAYAFVNTWGVAQPDRSIFNSLQVRPHGQDKAFTAISVTPTSGGGCDASYTHVVVIKDKTCPEIREKTLGGWKFYADVGGVPLYEDPTAPTINVALLPQSDGCLVIKSGSLIYPAPK